MHDPATPGTAVAPASAPPALPRPTVFFISDGTGITAETFGNSILSQFAIKPRHLRRPFIDTPDKATPGRARDQPRPSTMEESRSSSSPS